MTTTPLACDAAMSDDVLQAARAAAAKHIAYADRKWAPERWINSLPEKQRPLVPLLIALLDCAQSTAKAINDNAWDESIPLTASLADELAAQCKAITDAIKGATECGDSRGWSIPSMSGKELV